MQCKFVVFHANDEAFKNFQMISGVLVRPSCLRDVLLQPAAVVLAVQCCSPRARFNQFNCNAIKFHIESGFRDKEISQSMLASGSNSAGNL